MVDIVIRLDSVGCLCRLTARGHSEYQKTGGVFTSAARRGRKKTSGIPLNDPACAAVSLSLRSIARLIMSRSGWRVDGEAPESGNLLLVVIDRPGGTDDWLRGVTDTLIRTLADVEADYPKSIVVRMEEMHDGT